MRGSLKRSAVVFAGLLLVAMAVLPMAIATAATAENVLNGDEAWFLQNQEPLTNVPGGDPTCALPTGCNAAGNATRKPTPHPEGTLVVAANAGQEDAQLYFNFNMDDLPLGTVVTGGTVKMPVSLGSEDGNFNAESAKLVACLVTGFIPGGAEGGSWQDRPPFDDNTCVKVELDPEAETPTFTFDLDRFGKVWGTGSQPVNGVTVMKDPEVAPPAPDETWRVVFNTARRHNNAEDPDAVPAITSTLQYKTLSTGPLVPVPPADSGTTGSTSGGTTTGSTTTGSSSSGFSSGSTGGSFDSGSVGTADTGTVAPPVSAGAPAAQPPAAAAGQPVAAGGAVPAAATPQGLSPAVWLMPLLALAMAGALAWSLMQPVELAGDREGAVSKLMRNRRLAADAPSPT